MKPQLNIGNFTPAGGMATTGNHTAVSGGRKPTADSHAYTLYKPNKNNPRAKFSNGGGSLSGQQDGSFEAGYAVHNNSFMSMGGDKNINMSNFSTGPNTTATRFYNPKHAQGGNSPSHMNETQSRFMQNL